MNPEVITGISFCGKGVDVRLGMMQPYFFPYLGYFGLIHATDCWVVFDTPQYVRRSWINRNRILSTGGNLWKYVRIPVSKAGRTIPIREIRIAKAQDWKQDLINQFDVYHQCQAPYYDETVSFVRDTLSLKTNSLCELLIHCLKSACAALDLRFDFQTFSETDLKLREITAPGEWALETSRAMGATEYINPPGGRSLFDPEHFAGAGVSLKFLEPTRPAYQQGPGKFLADLSIIDVMMWNDLTTVRRMVSDYQLKAA